MKKLILIIITICSLASCHYKNNTPQNTEPGESLKRFCFTDTAGHLIEATPCLAGDTHFEHSENCPIENKNK